MTAKRNLSLTISLDLFDAEQIVRLDKSLRLSAKNPNPDTNDAESDLADSEHLFDLVNRAIIGGKRSDWATDRDEVVRLAQGMMNVIA
jgi:hypothetical protein